MHKYQYFLISCLLFCFCCSESKASSINYVTVQSQGSGQTYGSAVGSALSYAISQVNGAVIASEFMTTEVLETLDTATESDLTSSMSTFSKIQKSMNGIIKEYRVLSQNSDGFTWNVHVEAVIVKFDRSAQNNRIRLVVLPFRANNSNFNIPKNLFVQETVSHLTQSKKFSILDRDFEQERLAEIDIYSSKHSPVEEMARLGNRLGTDYMIVGIINDASSRSRTINIDSVGKSATTRTSRFSVSYRLIDVPTGQIKFSDKWERSSENLSVSGIIKIASEEISRKIIDSIFPITVVSIQEDILFLGQGGKSMKNGQEYHLIKLGDQLVDAHTGEIIGHEEFNIGNIQIIEVQSNLSKAKILSTTIDINHEFQTSKFIVRLKGVSSSAKSHSTPRQSPVQTKDEYKKKVDDMRESVQDLW